ncbi:MAG: GNAT family N-acetyltransferase [Bdellovibrio sp.]|nr:GNAT family N-acetyltransferase [Methylotenera sp.]
MQANIQIVEVTWQQAEHALRAIRTPVFIEEQAVAPDFEWDEIDHSALHLLASVDMQAVACLRIINYHKIGRMAVLKAFRSNGVGAALLQEAVNICKQHGSKTVHLSAQTHAIGFYEKCGFNVTSDSYQDVHIAHVDMQLDLNN